MNYAIICAGGIGSRMGNVDLPKQFIELDGKPIIIHTIEKFFINPDFRKVIILCPKNWTAHTEYIIEKYVPQNEKIIVLAGGSTRNETIMNALAYIEETDGIDDETIVLTHDAVRPFVTTRIIEENIALAKKYGATDTVVPATDTIVQSDDGQVITNIPNRAHMYQGQTPQTFAAKKLKELYEGLSDEEKDILTDACKIFSMKGHPVALVKGEVQNVKITYPYDLKVAKAIIGEE